MCSKSSSDSSSSSSDSSSSSSSSSSKKVCNKQENNFCEVAEKPKCKDENKDENCEKIKVLIEKFEQCDKKGSPKHKKRHKKHKHSCHKRIKEIKKLIKIMKHNLKDINVIRCKIECGTIVLCDIIKLLECIIQELIKKIRKHLRIACPDTQISSIGQFRYEVRTSGSVFIIGMEICDTSLLPEICEKLIDMYKNHVVFYKFLKCKKHYLCKKLK